MNREEAEKVLNIIRNVIQNTREDLVEHNWGLIWITHSFIDAAACLAGWYVESQGLGIFWYLVPLAAAGLFNVVSVQVLAQRDQGVRSYVQWQMYGIWVSFIIFTAAFALVLHGSGSDPKLFGPVFALTSGFGFAMMGVVFSRQFPFAFLFLVVMLVSPLLPAGMQWGLIALVWWAAMFLPGLSMYREKRQRDHDRTATRIL